MEKTLIKSKYGVYLYEVGDRLEMYIEEYLVLDVAKEFKGMVMKSYDNLINLREKDYEK